MPARTTPGESALRRIPPVAPLLFLILLMPVPTDGGLEAQTPYTELGLGYPVSAIDARSAAMGGVGPGLAGGSFTLRHPADLVAIDAPALSVTLSPERVTLRGTGDPLRTARNRFPLLRGVVPFRGWVFGIGFGSVIDQDWSFRFRDTLFTGAGDFPYVERREQDGGISALDFSVARRLGPISLGVSWEYLTGSLRQVLNRRYLPDEESDVTPPGSVDQVEEHGYSGWRGRGGLSLRPFEGLRLSASYGVSGDLTARADRSGAVRRFDLPDEVAVKASLRVGEDWLATVGGTRVYWSSAAGDLTGTARDVSRVGGGLEYRGLGVGSFPFRLRAGARMAELPFALPGAEPPDERALTFGVGTVFSDERAALDLALETGSRGEVPRTGVEEEFLRLSFTATIRQ